MSLTRNTLFALLMALEGDLRQTMTKYVEPSRAMVPDEAERASARWRGDRPRGQLQPLPAELLDYVDLSELLDMLDRHAAVLSTAVGTDRDTYHNLMARLRSLVPIRNRVCHARPLEPDDFTAAWSTIDGLVGEAPSGLDLVGLADTRRRLSEAPAYPLTLVIPDFWRRDATEIPNNLPVPEYDDTGFIGRKRERESVLRLLRGAHRIVTITGEGGVGKTSLALQTLYDAAVDPDRPFDHIVWVSLKTETLTTAGARQLADALTTPTGLLERVAATGGDVPAFDDLQGLIEYVIELLTGVRVLLVIDNLETIDRDALRPLFLELPATSKVLITSRHGIGEFETRYALSEMDRPDAVRLLRSVGRLLNAEGLWKRDDAQLADICERLFRNPLAIRWFAQSYSEGRSVSDLLERKRNFGEVLNFCFHTLYESLSDQHRSYLRIMVAVGKPLSEVQLALLAGAPSLDEMRASLHYLHSSNLVRRTSDDWATAVASLWTTSDFARAYIVNRDSQIVPERPGIVKRFRALIQARDDARDVTYTNPFRTRAIHARTTDEASVVYLLNQALRAAAESDFRAALESVDKAKQLQPGFYEVWRVSGQVRCQGDPLGAQQDFERALELANGSSEPLLAFVANFMADQDDAAGAVELLEPVATKSAADPRLVATFARMLGLSGNLGRSIVEFGRVENRFNDLGGLERGVVATQYAEILRRAAEAELQRQRPDHAIDHLCKALELMQNACLGNYVDRVLVREARDCVDLACRVVLQRCSIEWWERLHTHLAPLRDYIPLPSAATGGPEALAFRCPEVAARKSFQEVFGQAKAPTVMFGDVLAPALGRDYTFIRADDARDYFLHKSEIADGSDWNQVGTPGWTRVRFHPGAGRPDKGPSARSAVLVHLADD
ncbi:MAG: AAA family ATPase [Candidatus Limnocylindrales bacterium]